MENTRKCLISKIATITLVVFGVAVLLFQSLAFISLPTNAEARQELIQQQRLENLALNLTLKNGAYLIEDAHDLKILSDELHNYSTDTSTLVFKQTKNIDMSVLKKQNKTFYPIGRSGNPFRGKFYGQNYTIANLYTTKTNGSTGLFGTVKNAKLEGIFISSGSVSVTGSYGVGAIVGLIQDSSSGGTTITNCVNAGCTVTGTNNNYGAGGIVGEVSSSSGSANISGCLNMAAVTNNATGKAYAGGIVGYSNRLYAVTKCMNTGTITAGNSSGGTTEAYAGGIVGYNLSSTTTYCLNKGNIYSRADKQTIDTAYFDTPAMTKVLSGSDTNDNYMLFMEGQNAIDRSYENAYAGGISGAFFGDSYSYSICAFECVNLSSTISGGGYSTDSTTTFYAGMDAALISSEDAIGEKYSVHMSEFVDYSSDIGYSTGKSYSKCYSKYKDSNRTAKLNFTFASQTYKVTSNSSIGSIVPKFSTGKSVGSWYTNRGVIASQIFAASSNNLGLNKYVGLNNLKIRSIKTGGGDCPNDKPGFYDNKVSANVRTSGGKRIFYIDYSFYWAYYKAAGAFNWEEDYDTEYYTTQVEYVTLQNLPKIATQISSNSLSSLSTSYFAINSSINGGYPYLKHFYWLSNIQKPS